MSKELRKKLRANSTLAERAFWQLIRPFRTGGYHFRKQVEIGSYYVDFACLHAQLVIEVDGDSHGDPVIEANDEVRDEYLASRGFKVLRFNNEDVLRYGDGVFDAMQAALEHVSPRSRVNSPSPTLPARGRVQSGA